MYLKFVKKIRVGTLIFLVTSSFRIYSEATVELGRMGCWWFLQWHWGTQWHPKRSV